MEKIGILILNISTNATPQRICRSSKLIVGYHKYIQSTKIN